jgi:hypothetical protein
VIPSREVDPGKRVTMLTLVIAGTIKDVGDAPSGSLYAMLMSLVPDLDINEYQRIMEVLKKIGVITESGHTLRYKGNPPFDRVLAEFDELGKSVGKLEGGS